MHTSKQRKNEVNLFNHNLTPSTYMIMNSINNWNLLNVVCPLVLHWEVPKKKRVSRLLIVKFSRLWLVSNQVFWCTWPPCFNFRLSTFDYKFALLKKCQNWKQFHIYSKSGSHYHGLESHSVDCSRHSVSLSSFSVTLIFSESNKADTVLWMRRMCCVNI